MAGVRIEFAQFGYFSSFDILRSITPMSGLADNQFPTPIATDLKSMYYVDAQVSEGTTYYYMIRVWADDGNYLLSDEFSILVQVNDPLWDDVLSLLHFEGNFNDEKGNIWGTFGIDQGNMPRLTTVNPLFGSGSLDANPDQLNYSEHGLQTSALLGLPFTGDFTIEWFQNIRSWNNPMYQAALCNGYQVTGGITAVTGLRDGRYALYSGTTLICTEATMGPVNTRVHYAITRTGANVSIWRGGELSASGTFAGPMGLSNRGFALGAYSSDSGALGQMLNGLIDEFRITKGRARYIEQFSPPDLPFPSK
ncbi:LamG-like jellyroll fold domain-containing protein [Acinetobacter beijerinckii]|uniref:LamG-like jellyroll fold domain-containing protein n=1 Tax=Acinetobacter beijerinckii TaxID=262668 RepID=UPI0030D9A7CD